MNDASSPSDLDPQRDRPGPRIVYAADGSAEVWYPPRAPEPAGVSFAPDERAPDESIAQFHLSFCATSIAVAAKLQLGSIFSIHGDMEGKAIFYDAVATTDYYAEAADPAGGLLYAVRHGIGVRLALKATRLKIETNLSYSMIAAQARGSGASVFYEVQGIGVPPQIVRSMLGALPTSGPLTESSYTRLDHVLRVELPDYLAEPDNPLTTSEYIVVPRPREGDPRVEHARAFNFAMTQIARARSLSRALDLLADDERLAGDLGRFLVMYVYSNTAGVVDPGSTQSPGAAAVARAKAWLTT